MRPWRKNKPPTREQLEERLKRRVELELPQFAESCKDAVSANVKDIAIPQDAFDDDDLLWSIVIKYAKIHNINLYLVSPELYDPAC